MTPKQAEEIREIIRHDASATAIIATYGLREDGGYGPLDEPTYCVLGGLAKAAGTEDSKLRGDALGGLSNAGRKAIKERFGLDSRQMGALYGINDAHEDVEKRRAALCKRIDTWEEKL